MLQMKKWIIEYALDNKKDIPWWSILLLINNVLFSEKVFALLEIECLFFLEKSGQCSYSAVLTV